MSDSTNYGETFGERFQQHALAVCLRVPGFLLRYRTALSYDYFVSDIHKAVAKGLIDHVDKFKTLPTVSTLLECVRPEVDEATMTHVSSLCEKLYKDDISDAAAVQAKIIDFGQTQALCKAVIESAEFIEKGKKDRVSQLISEAMLVGQDILDLGIDFKAALPDLLTNLDDDESRDVVPTGIRHVDLLMGGGLGRGELGVILAPPKKGKTTTLINFGFGAATNPQGYVVVHFSLEMSERKVARRYIDRFMGPLAKTRSRDPKAFKVEMVARAKKYLAGRLFVKGYPTRAATPSKMRAYLTLLTAQGISPDLIIVDYADIAKAERRLGDMRHEQAGIYEDLRAIAGEFNAAMWTGSQGKQSSLEKSTITIADFAESFEKAAIVDAAFGFCQTQGEKVDRKCRLFAAALRGADDGATVECEIHRDRCYIKSTALYDAANSRMDDGDEPDDDKKKKDVGDLKERVSASSPAPASSGPKKATVAKAPVLGTGVPIPTGTPAQGPNKGPFKKSGEKISKKVGPA